MTLGGSIRSEKSKTVWVSRLFALNRTKKTAYMPKFVNIGYTSCLTNIYLYIYISRAWSALFDKGFRVFWWHYDCYTYVAIDIEIYQWMTAVPGIVEKSRRELSRNRGLKTNRRPQESQNKNKKTQAPRSP